MNNSIAILLPIYKGNNLDHLRQAIESLYKQSLQNFDIIICVDGELPNNINHYISTISNRNVRIVYNNEQLGLAHNLNAGLQYILENGYEYIARMDGDDIAIFNRLELQFEFLRNNVEIDIVGGYITEIDKNGKSRGKVIQYPVSNEQCFKFFSKRSMFAHPTVMIRSSFFRRNGLYPTKRLVEYDEISILKKQKYKFLTNIFDRGFINFGGREDTVMWFLGYINKSKYANIPIVLLKYRIIDYDFKHRNVSIKRAIQMFYERIIINGQLNYGLTSYIFAVLRFLLDLSPSYLKSFSYRTFR